MRPCHLDCAKRNQRKTRTCNCGLPESEDPEDAELCILFQDLALTLLDLMDPDDADILARLELRGQTISEIATLFRCSQAEASRRLIHAQRNFCQMVVLTLVPVKSE